MLKNLTSLSFALAASLASACGGAGTCPATATAESAGIPLTDPITAPMSITLTSSSFADGQTIPMQHVFDGMGCGGGNISPELSWANAPEGTQSFALVVHDPDAPTGVGFFHWILADIPAGTTSLASGAAAALPAGVVSGHTDFGTTTYGGPCPPPGAPHRYVFTLYALDVPSLGVDANASGALTRFMLGQHTLAYGRLTGTWARPTP